MPKPIYSKITEMKTRSRMTLAGATVTIIAYLLREQAGIELPADVGAAAVVIVAFVFGYLQIEKQ